MGKRMWISASYTVEAAYIVPFILGIIFALLYFLYYEHDKIVLHGNMQEAVIQIARGEEELPDGQKWRKEMQEGLWMAEMREGSATKNILVVKGLGRAEMSLQIPVMEFFLRRQQSVNDSVKWEVWQPEQLIRWKGVLPGTEEDGHVTDG